MGVGAARCRHERAVRHVQVVDVPDAAVRIEHRNVAAGAEAQAAHDVVGDPHRVAVHRAVPQRVVGRHAVAQYLPALISEHAHQRPVVRVPVLDDMADLAVPLVAHVRMQLDPVDRARDLVGHEGDGEPRAEGLVQPCQDALGTLVLIALEAAPERIQVGVALGARHGDRQALVGGVVIDRAAGPEVVAADEVLGGARVGGVVAVQGNRLVEPVALDLHLGAAERVGQEVAAQMAAVLLVAHRPAEALRVLLGGQHQQADRFHGGTGDDHEPAGNRPRLAAGIAVAHLRDPSALHLEVGDDAVRAQFQRVPLRDGRAQQRYPGVGFQAQRVAVAIDVADLGEPALASAGRVVLGDHRQGGAVRLHPELFHAGPRVLADRIGRHRLLIEIARRERLPLPALRPVDAQQPLGLRVERLQVLVAERPVADVPHRVALRVAVQPASFVEALQPEVEFGEPQ